MATVFIAGTDTAAGKTIITALLACYLKSQNIEVVTQKWVNSGRDNDLKTHLKTMGDDARLKEMSDFLCPYRFSYPASPHLCQKLERKRISIKKIEKSLDFLKSRFPWVLIEGIGGLAVPLKSNLLLIDLIKKFNLEVILIAKNTLGAINHTILSIESLKRRDIFLRGVIFNQVKKKEDDLILKDNPRIVKKITRVNILGVLNYNRNIKALYKEFLPIAKRIFSLYG